MAKKKKNPVSMTLSRLATTVRVDMPQMVAQGGQALGATVRQQGTRLSRAMDRLNVFSPEAQARRRLERAGAKPKTVKVKVRRSRLPYLILASVMLLCSLGYWGYSKLTLPDLGVARHLDGDQWLRKVSGLQKPWAEPRRDQRLTAEYKSEWTKPRTLAPKAKPEGSKKSVKKASQKSASIKAKKSAKSKASAQNRARLQHAKDKNTRRVSAN